ncbi:fructosyl amino acid oxidase [Coniella lustricola]|uniref:Fructosyl amino acid oxidase n=1 Tax=Coniella lustricola TaxID=2025994 RepID=A0A2T3A3H2_9PEZI|nr:fructosyl amino acid oxidase [Coniella lustricola]
MTNLRASTRVLVVGGAGTIGSSTALHLLRAGYTPQNITVLDVYPFPSAQSAGNDVNKIMGIRVSSKAEIQLSLEAVDMWDNDALFKPFFHRTGRIDCEVSPKGIAALRREYEILVEAGLHQGHEWIDTEDELLAKAPLLPEENIKGWKALYSKNGGWLAAANAINAVGEYCRDQGVHFRFGGAGSFKQPIFAKDSVNDNEQETCIGVETEDGTKYYADKVVLAAGAWSPVLVDLEEQCCSKAWVYAHIQLSPSEALAYKAHPVIYHGDIGFFFEPNEQGVIKICDEFPGFTRYKLPKRPPYYGPVPSASHTQSQTKPISIPRSHAKHPTDTYPDASEVSIRKALETYLPRFKDKQLFNRTLCWCTDTADSSLLICEHPRWRNFVLATGDSGHTFKLLPSIGKHVVDLLEGHLAEELAHTWRWRPGTGNARKSTRAAEAQDLADMPGWNHDDDGVDD